MIVSQARGIVQNTARAARDSSYYTFAMIDVAMQAAGDELIRRCQLLPILSNITLSNGNATLPAFPTNAAGVSFRPDRLINAYLTGANVHINGAGYLSPTAPYDSLGAPATQFYAPPATTRLANIPFIALNDATIGLPATGQPQAISFSSMTTGACYPTPNDNFTCMILWSDFFTTWVAGDTSNQTLNTVINLPDDLLRPVLYYGAPLYLQYNETEDNATVKVMEERWNDAINDLAGRNSLYQTVFAVGSGGSAGWDTTTGW